jgi:hypothetical protein
MPLFIVLIRRDYLRSKSSITHLAPKSSFNDFPEFQLLRALFPRARRKTETRILMSVFLRNTRNARKYLHKFLRRQMNFPISKIWSGESRSLHEIWRRRILIGPAVNASCRLTLNQLLPLIQVPLIGPFHPERRYHFILVSSPTFPC